MERQPHDKSQIYNPLGVLINGLISSFSKTQVSFLPSFLFLHYYKCFGAGITKLVAEFQLMGKHKF